MLCSGLFVSGRTGDSVRSSDLAADDLAPLRYLTTDVDADARRVRAHLLGMASRTAVHRGDLGCVVDDASSAMTVPSSTITRHSRWEPLDQPKDEPALGAALDWAFAEPDPARMRRTRAVVVAHDGRIVFDEDSIDPRGGVLFMLLRAPDVPAYAAASPLNAPPGTRWHYSSATTNLIMAAIRRRVGEAEYSTLPRRALFDRLGMHSAVMETDAHGNFIGSSFVYATARDWARFGLLYLGDGVWNGNRILPEGWVAYSRTPAPAAPVGEYGAHFWLKVAPTYEQPSAQFAFPPDTFHAIGHEGQFVTIVPSRRVVIVRLGLTRTPGAWDHREFVRRVLDAIAHATGQGG